MSNVVTLKKIAEITGKSKATISLVLNSKQYHRVSPKTLAEIQRVADSLGYIPNQQAQALVSGRTRTIAISTLAMSPFYNEYINLLTAIFEEYGYTVFAFQTMYSQKREKQIINWVRQGVFEGCICLEYFYSNRLNYEPLIKSGIPHVFRGWDTPETAPDAMIRIDYRTAIAELFFHLKREGWHNLAIIIDNDKYTDTPDMVRKLIYYEQINEAGMEIALDSWIAVPISVENHLNYVYTKLRSVLAKNPQIDAVIVQSASEIPAVYKAAKECGRIIGNDLAVATFDRISLLDFMEPPVTYVYEPVTDIARMIADDMLYQLGDLKEPPAADKVIKTKLTVRESTLKKE